MSNSFKPIIMDPDESGYDYEMEIKIIDHIGVIKEYPTGWCKEINLASINGCEPKIDIRDFSQDHQHFSRGITLRKDEMDEMIKHYNKWKEKRA